MKKIVANKGIKFINRDTPSRWNTSYLLIEQCVMSKQKIRNLKCCEFSNNIDPFLPNYESYRAIRNGKKRNLCYDKKLNTSCKAIDNENDSSQIFWLLEKSQKCFFLEHSYCIEVQVKHQSRSNCFNMLP